MGFQPCSRLLKWNRNSLSHWFQSHSLNYWHNFKFQAFYLKLRLSTSSEVHNAHFSQHLILQEKYPCLKYASNEGSIYFLFLQFLQCWLLWPGGRRESLLRYSLEYDTGFHAVFTHSSRSQSLFLSVLCLESSVQDKACMYKGLLIFRTSESQLTRQCHGDLAKI